MTNVLVLTPKTKNNIDLSETSKSLEAQCRNCTPITPIYCITRCKVYRLKNELRTVHLAMKDPDYLNELFNVLKNDVRFHILQTIANGRYRVNKIQQELNKTGHRISQHNIRDEYLHPLMSIGLAAEERNEYYATTFGSRIAEMLIDLPEFAKSLPTRSEGYEEALLKSLLSGPKTFGDIKALILPKTISRTLKRLRSTGLIKTRAKKDYIFFFKSRRDPDKDPFTCSERKIYEVIDLDGISAGMIAKKTGFSMRRTYKSLRSLKGKKLVFSRRMPKVYGLTYKGTKLASVLQELQQIVDDIWSSSEKVMQENALMLKDVGLSKNAFC
jgi:DNA-binding HxlR family transcriptional regulator